MRIKCKKDRNSCYIYFAITGEFNPDDITDVLELNPVETWRIGDKCKFGKNRYYDFALWEYGKNDTYDVITENQMMITISDLKTRIQLLQEIKQKYDVSFTLEVVPVIYVGESTPTLAPNREIIEFCYLTGTKIDIDLYINK